MLELREQILSDIDRDAPIVLELLEANGYPGMEPLTFQVKTLLGRYKDQVQAGWKLGTYHVQEGFAHGEGNAPLHLLSDGMFAAGSLRLDVYEFDTRDWWRLHAPETIRSGLQRMLAELRPESDAEPK